MANKKIENTTLYLPDFRGFNFDRLVLTVVETTRPIGIGLLETGFQFRLSLEYLCRGNTYEELSQKLSIKKKGVSLPTIKRFHKRYASVIDPVRKIALLIKNGEIRPDDLLSGHYLDVVKGNYEITKTSDFREPISGNPVADTFLKYAEKNSPLKSNVIPRTVAEQARMRKEGSCADLTRVEVKSEKMTLLDFKLGLHKKETTQKPEIKRNTK